MSVSLVPCDLVISYVSLRRKPTVFLLINGSWVDRTLGEGVGWRRTHRGGLGVGSPEPTGHGVEGLYSGGGARKHQEWQGRDPEGREANKGCCAVGQVMPSGNSTGEHGEVVRSTPELACLRDRAFTLNSHLVLAGQFPGASAPQCPKLDPCSWRGSGWSRG